MEQVNMASANNEVLQKMERLTINQLQTRDSSFSLNIASLQISDQIESTSRVARSVSKAPAQALCIQSSPIRPSSSITDMTRDMVNDTSSRSPVHPNVTKAYIRHHQVPTDPRVRFDYKKRYFEYCLLKRETLLHLAAPKGTSKNKSRAAASSHVRHRYSTLIGQTGEIELTRRALSRARLEYGRALRELRRATKTRVAGEEIITKKVGEVEVPSLMKEEVVLGGISDDIVTEE